jgi:ATP-dependent RNA helicase DOB1
MMEDEDEKLRKEGELIEQVIGAGGSEHIGYDENDYVVEV